MLQGKKSAIPPVVLSAATVVLLLFLLFRADATDLAFRRWYAAPTNTPPFFLRVANSNIWWLVLVLAGVAAVVCTRRALADHAMRFHCLVAGGLLAILAALGVLYAMPSQYIRLLERPTMVRLEQVGCKEISLEKGRVYQFPTPTSPALVIPGSITLKQVGRFRHESGRWMQECVRDPPVFAFCGIVVYQDKNEDVGQFVIVDEVNIEVRTLVLLALLHPALVLPFCFWHGRRRKRRNEGLCLKCGYNLTGLPEPRCPECGTQFVPANFHLK